MLRKSGDNPMRSRPPRSATRWSALALLAVVLALLVLRLDFWHHNAVQPMLFGFLPVGLWWQAMISILAAGMMWLMVRLAWPAHLEELERNPISAKDPHHADSRREAR